MNSTNASLRGLWGLISVLLMAISLSACGTNALDKRLVEAKRLETEASIALRNIEIAREQLYKRLPEMPKVCGERVLVTVKAQGDEPLDLLVLRYDAALTQRNDVGDYCYQWYGKVREAFNPGARDAR